MASQPPASGSPSLKDRLFQPVDASSLGAFRILFGSLLLVEILSYLQPGRLEEFFLRPRLLFRYELFPFVEPWPAPWLRVHFAVLAAAASGIVLGLFYRLSALLFFLGYLYVFLLDKGQYNNHYYLIVLLAFLMAVVPAQRWASVDQMRHPRPAVVPYWSLLLLRAQIVIVFFFGGLAKLTPDWLAGEPMRTWLMARSGTPWIGAWLASDAAAYGFSYAGLLFDLSVGFLLLWRRTLPLAVAGMLLFNLSNHWLFDIGIFPFLMLASVVLFLRPEEPRLWLARLRGIRVEAATGAAEASRPSLVLCFLGIYLALQLLLPLRPWLYPGDVGWTEEGILFSWQMKLRTKSGRVRFKVSDSRSGRTWDIDPGLELNAMQRQRLAYSPALILDYAHFLRDQFQHQGLQPTIRVESVLSVNRRPAQALVDPSVDLAEVPRSVMAASDWIVPLDRSGRPGSLSPAEFYALAVGERPAAGAP